MDAPQRIPLHAIGTALIFASFWVLTGSFVARPGWTPDFLNLYSGAQLAAEGRWADLHKPSVQREIAVRNVPGVKFVMPYVRPSFHALAIMPLAAAPLRIAFVLWLGLGVAVYAAWCWWAARRFGPDALLLGAMSLPAGLGIAHGQDVVWMLSVVAGSYWLASRGRGFGAGAVLALGLAKFHLMIFFPVLMLVGRRFRMLAGFTMVGCVLLAVSLALGGLEGARSYVALLTSGNSLVEPSPELQMNIAAAMTALGAPSVATMVLVAAAAVLVIAIGFAKHGDWTFYAAGAAGALLCVRHTYGYDAIILVPGLWLAFRYARERATRMVAVFLCSPAPFLPGLLGFGGASFLMPLALAIFVFCVFRETRVGVATQGRSAWNSRAA